MLAMVIELVPELDSVNCWEELVVPTPWLEKLRPGGPSEAMMVMPVPDSVALWVLPVTPPALSVTVMVAEREPVVVGSKVTAIVQEPEAATGVDVEQVVPVVAIAKSPGFVPPSAMLAMVRDDPVGLLNVKD